MSSNILITVKLVGMENCYGENSDYLDAFEIDM